ncbi:AMP-binding protein, partial [Clostridium perfringens]
SFDASGYDIFSAICCGARLHLLSNEQRYSVEAFTAAIEEQSATRIGILPTVFFNQLSAHLNAEQALKYGNIRSFVIGGEALPGESVRSLQRKLPHLPVIVNAYGPTEVTVATTTHLMDSPVPE